MNYLTKSRKIRLGICKEKESKKKKPKLSETANVNLSYLIHLPFSEDKRVNTRVRSDDKDLAF